MVQIKLIKILIVNAFTELFSLTDDEKLTLNNTIQFLFDHNKIKQIKKVIVVGNKIKNWFIKKFAWYVFDNVIKTKIPLINALIIKMRN